MTSTTDSDRGALLSVTYRGVGDLSPDPRNARSHAKRQIEQIIASIRAFGFTNPILTDPDGVVIAGHGRLQAAKGMGLVEVPTIVLAGLTDAQKRALRLADNKIALNAGWDIEFRLSLRDRARDDCLRSSLAGQLTRWSLLSRFHTARFNAAKLLHQLSSFFHRPKTGLSLREPN